MSGSDWGKGIADLNWTAILWAVALSTLALVSILNVAGHKPSAYQEQYQAQCHDAKSRYWLIIGNSLEALSANEDTETGKREKKGREQVTYWCDLFAQQTAADAARYTASQSLWVTLLTGLGVLLIAGTLVYTRKTLIETQDATRAAHATTEVTREMGEQAEKAFIVVESACRKTLNNFGCTFRHFGKTPAFGIDVHVTYTVFTNEGLFFENKSWFRRAFVLPTDSLIEKNFDFPKVMLEIERKFGEIPCNGMHRLDFHISYFDVFSFGSLRTPNITNQTFQTSLDGCGPMLCVSTYARNSQNAELKKCS